MKTYLLWAVALVALIATGCGHSHDHGQESGHHHDEPLQITAYGNDFEVYAEADPLTVGEAGDILSHFTYLSDFKPLAKGKVTATLTVNGKSVSQTLDAPGRPGVYKFNLTPEVAGEGTLTYDIVAPDLTSRIVAPVTVYADKHDAEHAAADAAASSSNGVAFIKEVSWNVDFSTEPVESRPFGQIIKTMAQVQPSQSDECVVSAKTSGIVRLADSSLADGKAVSAGQTLFYIDASGMADNNLSVRIREAEANYNYTKAEYERLQELAKERLVVQSRVEEAKAAYESAKALYESLRGGFSSGRQAASTPIAGFVKQILVQNGQHVEAGQPLAVVSKNKDLFIKAEIQPRYYSALHNISNANLRLSNGEVYSLNDLGGKLVSYGRAIDTDNPLVPVVFQLNNVLDLLPGSFVEMFINAGGDTKSLTVPNESLIEEMGNYFVYVQLTPEFFEKRQVKIGKSDGACTEILGGVKEGERVVAKGAVLVKLTHASGTLDAHAGHVH